MVEEGGTTPVLFTWDHGGGVGVEPGKISAFAFVMMRRPGGMLLALPAAAVEEEVLDRHMTISTGEEPLVGPYTVLYAPAVSVSPDSPRPLRSGSELAQGRSVREGSFLHCNRGGGPASRTTTSKSSRWHYNRRRTKAQAEEADCGLSGKPGGDDCKRSPVPHGPVDATIPEAVPAGEKAGRARPPQYLQPGHPWHPAQACPFPPC